MICTLGSWTWGPTCVPPRATYCQWDLLTIKPLVVQRLSPFIPGGTIAHSERSSHVRWWVQRHAVVRMGRPQTPEAITAGQVLVAPLPSPTTTTQLTATCHSRSGPHWPCHVRQVTEVFLRLLPEAAGGSQHTKLLLPQWTSLHLQHYRQNVHTHEDVTAHTGHTSATHAFHSGIKATQLAPEHPTRYCCPTTTSKKYSQDKKSYPYSPWSTKFKVIQCNREHYEINKCISEMVFTSAKYILSILYFP